MIENEEFTLALRRLRELAGMPTYPQLAEETGFSRSHIAQIFNGHQRGSWQVVRALVLALDGDLAEIEPLYHRYTCRGPHDVGPPANSEIDSIAAFLTLAVALAVPDDPNGVPECCADGALGHWRAVEIRSCDAPDGALWVRRTRVL